MFIRRKIELTEIMSRIDPVALLLRLGIVNPKTGEPITLNDIKIRGEELTTYCPDHYIFVNRLSSDPNWGLNLRTGLCNCFTEPRGSNIVATVARIRNVGYDEAVEWILGDSTLDASLNSVRAFCGKLKDISDSKSNYDKSLELREMKKVIDSHWLSPQALEYFMRPPGKKPTLITEETVRFFGVSQCESGRFGGRAIIPCYQLKKLKGFIAIDIYGKEAWARRNPLCNPDKDYRKVLYPSMKIGDVLFNYDNVQKGCEELFLTEGPREVMKLHQQGHPNSVALLGGNLTEHHLFCINEIKPKIVTVFMDGDDAGQRFSVKIGEKLSNYDFDQKILVKVALTPEGFDPKSLDSQQLEDTIKNSIFFSEIS